jgi:hypothetical protein
MPTRSEAEENLRVIRSLMEKATIYRAISAEAAAVGGILAIIGSFSMGNWVAALFLKDRIIDTAPNRWAFFGTWTVVLILATAANLYVLRRAATSRGDRFISQGMKLALVSLLPSFVVAGLLTLLVLQKPLFVVCVPVWISCYGLALLATRHFAPRSLVWLGWAFIGAGMLAFIYVGDAIADLFYPQMKWPIPLDVAAWSRVYLAQALMAATFGLFHLIYAASTWSRKPADGEPGGPP